MNLHDFNCGLFILAWFRGHTMPQRWGMACNFQHLSNMLEALLWYGRIDGVTADRSSRMTSEVCITSAHIQSNAAKLVLHKQPTSFLRGTNCKHNYLTKPDFYFVTGLQGGNKAFHNIQPGFRQLPTANEVHRSRFYNYLSLSDCLWAHGNRWAVHIHLSTHTF